MTTTNEPTSPLQDLSSGRVFSSAVNAVKSFTDAERKNISKRITALFNAIRDDNRPSAEYTNHVTPAQNVVYSLDANGAAIKNEDKTNTVSARLKAVHMAAANPGKFFGVWNKGNDTVQMYYNLKFAERKKALRQIFKDLGHSVFYRPNIKKTIAAFNIIPQMEP